jgi:hypothetical protein
MRKYLLWIICVLLGTAGFSQITTPQIKANFGVEADLSANFYNNGPTAAVDDWFRNVSVGTGRAVIDTTGANAIVQRYFTNPATRKNAIQRLMAFPAYSLINNRLMLDAVYHRDYHGQDSTVFGSGSNKNGMSPADWLSPGPAAIPDKNDILDAFVHVRRAGPNARDSLWMFAALSLENTTGNRFFDFELYQTDIAFNPATRNFSGYGPVAGHTLWEFDAAGNILKPGDIVFTAEFSSSALTVLEARIWVNRNDLLRTIPAFNWGGQFDGAATGSQYGYASIVPKTAGAFYTGLQSTVASTWAGPFQLVRDNDAVVSSYIPGQFMELSVNLSKLGIEPADFANSPCGSPFRRVLIKTRSSTSFTSELKDFVAPFRLFDYPDLEAYAYVNYFCGTMPTVPLTVANPISTSIYTWGTTNGHIVGSNIGDTIYVDAPGTYYVSQQLHSQCALFSQDSVTILFDSVCVVLNMDIRNLQAAKLNGQHQLKWQVTNNELAARYEVEYSTDNIHYTRMGILQATELTGSQQYSFEHAANLITAPVIYYRVRVIADNGQVKYSNIATLRNTKSGRNDAAIYPNPTKGELFLSCNNSVKENVDARVMDIFGRPVKEFKIELNAGENIINLPNLAALAQGTYLVRIPTTDGVIIQRIILRQ